MGRLGSRYPHSRSLTELKYAVPYEWHQVIQEVTQNLGITPRMQEKKSRNNKQFQIYNKYLMNTAISLMKSDDFCKKPRENISNFYIP